MINEKLVLVTDNNEKIENANVSNRNLEGNNAESTLKISTNHLYLLLHFSTQKMKKL